MARRRFVLAGRRFVLAGRRFILAGRRFVLAGCRFILAGRRFVLAGRRFVLARLGFVLAGLRFVLARVRLVSARLRSPGSTENRQHVENNSPFVTTRHRVQQKILSSLVLLRINNQQNHERETKQRKPTVVVNSRRPKIIPGMSTKDSRANHYQKTKTTCIFQNSTMPTYTQTHY